MPVNSNYVPLVTMSPKDGPADGFYTAQSAGAFNELAAWGDVDNHRSFGAFVAFTITGEYQQYTIDEDSAPTTQWLWGNLDLAGKTARGWAFLLQSSPAGQGQISAIVADSAGNAVTAAAVITGPNLPSPVGNIIFASLLFATGDNDGVTVLLALNGTIVASVRSLLAEGYAPSPYPARLGAAAFADTLHATTVQFISCGHAPLGPIPAMEGGQTGDGGNAMTAMWRGFASAIGGQNLVLQDFAYDWKHRYNAASLAAGIGASSAIKTAGGLILTGGESSYAIPPATWPDVGNQTAAVPATVAAVPLIKSGESPRLLGINNLPFYTPPALTFPTAP